MVWDSHDLVHRPLLQSGGGAGLAEEEIADELDDGALLKLDDDVIDSGIELEDIGRLDVALSVVLDCILETTLESVDATVDVRKVDSDGLAEDVGAMELDDEAVVEMSTEDELNDSAELGKSEDEAELLKSEELGISDKVVELLNVVELEKSDDMVELVMTEGLETSEDVVELMTSELEVRDEIVELMGMALEEVVDTIELLELLVVLD
ncbi:hypothetical protein BT63DRAFT_453132 [Microthyrium microscopicum]|uniref:Uncharacterized protein n=1 Tax=Microthyrium microscopicum TaxID=703497 RepID=A0A6A6UH47_9PEZI|nr:hypothetical protein BT63DRAFT_453132 [Microthyrium microscopicum]